MHTHPIQRTTGPAPPADPPARRSQGLSATSGWIVAAGACLAVAMLCHSINHYRTVLTTTMARLQLMPANVAEGAPESASGLVQLAEDAGAAADRL